MHFMHYLMKEVTDRNVYGIIQSYFGIPPLTMLFFLFLLHLMKSFLFRFKTCWPHFSKVVKKESLCLISNTILFVCSWKLPRQKSHPFAIPVQITIVKIWYIISVIETWNNPILLYKKVMLYGYSSNHQTSYIFLPEYLCSCTGIPFQMKKRTYI